MNIVHHHTASEFDINLAPQGRELDEEIGGLSARLAPAGFCTTSTFGTTACIGTTTGTIGCLGTLGSVGIGGLGNASEN